jgi:hypothetical protein
MKGDNEPQTKATTRHLERDNELGRFARVELSLAVGVSLSNFGCPVVAFARRGKILKVRWTALTLSLLLRGMINPRTGYALLTMAWRFRRRHWWRIPPFLPLPSAPYMQWRMHTAYGDHNAVPPASDVVRYARWAVRQ